MIPVDYSGVVFSTIHVDIANTGMNTVSEAYLRHLILNVLRSYKHKFSDKYGEMVVCLDSRVGYWRKDFFPFYKAGRREARAASSLDWDSIFSSVNKITEELQSVLPWKFIRVDKAEADDVMAVLAKHAPQLTGENILGEINKPCLIVSNDKDMIQMQKYKWVKQYRPCQKAFVSESNVDLFLIEHVLRGDKDDGVPNIRSAADTFMHESKRQSQITTKFIKSFLDNGESALTQSELDRYRDNQKLIDLSYIPEYIETDILEAYKNYPELPPKRKLLAYLASNGLNKLAERISEF